jgi:hypothetical protein
LVTGARSGQKRHRINRDRICMRAALSLRGARPEIPRYLLARIQALEDSQRRLELLQSPLWLALLHLDRPVDMLWTRLCVEGIERARTIPASSGSGRPFIRAVANAWSSGGTIAR